MSLESFNKQRFFVTGAAGFVGSHVVEALLKAGHEVVGLDDLSSGRKENLSEVLGALGSVRADRFKFIEGSICSADSLQLAIRGCQRVIHLAAIASVERCEVAPEHCQRVNVEGFRNIAEAAVRENARSVVFASSSAVYGMASDNPLRESDPLKPSSTYAASKLQNEKEAASWNGVKTAFRGLRFFNVYGPRQDPQSPYSGVISIFSDRILNGLPVVFNGDGQNTRDFIHVEDVVRATVAASLSDKREEQAVYNVATGRSISLLELFDAIVAAVEQTTGRRYGIRPVHAKPRAGDVRFSSAQVQRIFEEMGFRAEITLKKGIADLLYFLRAKDER